MEAKTHQETFDTVAVHLLTQNKQSLDPKTGTCLYRGPNGLKCAVGALIPDDKYHRSLEGHSAGAGKVAEILESLGHSTRLCDRLQGVHDGWTPYHWPLMLREIAKDLGLDFTKAQQVIDGKTKAS